MIKLRLFFYSHNNLLGLAFACLGPLLLLAGVLGSGWYVVSALAYGLGSTASSVFFTRAVLEHQTELTLDDLQSFLEKLLKENANQLPAEAVSHLQSIYESLVQAMPRFKEIASVTGAAGKEWTIFRQVILTYLPQTLSNYLRLPAAYVSLHTVGITGKTPKTLLVEQLGVMATELKTSANALFDSDLNQMLVNSKFLESKYGQAPDFLA